MNSKSKPATKRTARLGTKANPKPWAACPERDRADALGVIEECAKAAWCNGHQGAARAIQSALVVLRNATAATKEVT